MRADEEPNYDLDHDIDPMIGLAVTEPPMGGANDGTDTSLGKNDCPPGVHVYVVEAMGRMHPIDEFGPRICQSTRPRGFPPEGCGKLNAAATPRIRAAWANEPALSATLTPADSWSWEVAHKCADEIKTDLDLCVCGGGSTENANWGGQTTSS